LKNLSSAGGKVLKNSGRRGPYVLKTDTELWESLDRESRAEPALEVGEYEEHQRCCCRPQRSGAVERDGLRWKTGLGRRWRRWRLACGRAPHEHDGACRHQNHEAAVHEPTHSNPSPDGPAIHSAVSHTICADRPPHASSQVAKDLGRSDRQKACNGSGG
jgi:hypothetical protein